MRKEVAMMQNDLTGHLRVGAMPTMSPVLPFLIEKVREKHPGVRVDVQFIGNEAMKLGLNNFALDVALTYLDKADLGRKNTLPIYTEQLSLLVPDREEFRDRAKISWREAAQLPLAMLRASMHERRFVDQVFRTVGCSPVARVESESILHLMFQVQFTELCTIIPSHFVHAPGLHRGTRALALVDPVVTQEVGLFWAEGEIVLPMANAFVSIVQKLNKSGDIRRRLEGENQTVYDGPPTRRKRLAHA
jgi:DNA-binding transcriptional LysR family regulator